MLKPSLMALLLSTEHQFMVMSKWNWSFIWL